MRSTRVIAFGAAALLAACAQTPMGPTVQVMPGADKGLENFQFDQAGCKQFAEQSVAGQAERTNWRGVGASALTMALGAGLGAAAGSLGGNAGAGAGLGAAAGLVGGSGIGAASSGSQQGLLQQQYDNAYAQCMYARGNMVPSYGPMMSRPPPKSR